MAYGVINCVTKGFPPRLLLITLAILASLPYPYHRGYIKHSLIDCNPHLINTCSCHLFSFFIVFSLVNQFCTVFSSFRRLHFFISWWVQAQADLKEISTLSDFQYTLMCFLNSVREVPILLILLIHPFRWTG